MNSLHVLFSDEGHPVAIRKWSQEPFEGGEEYVRKSDLADLIAACDAAIDWADANARWFDISTAPRDGKGVLTYPHYRVTSWSDELGGFSFWSDYDDDEVLYNPQPTHWRPLPPPPSNPPLPAPLEALGAVLRRLKGVA